MDTTLRARLDIVIADLQRIFGPRLESVVAYGRLAHDWSHSLALVTTLTMEDLTALAAAAPQWHRAEVATPLVVPRDEFARSLDVFPIEYGEIIDTHVVIVGDDPFAGVRIAPADVRRAVEVQAASHLLHLREDYVEAGGRPAAVDALLRESAPGFASLLRRMAQLDGAPADTALAVSQWAAGRAGLDPRVVGDVLALAEAPTTTVDTTRLFPDYLVTMNALLRVVDEWSAS